MGDVDFKSRKVHMLPLRMFLGLSESVHKNAVIDQDCLLPNPLHHSSVILPFGAAQKSFTAVFHEGTSKTIFHIAMNPHLWKCLLLTSSIEKSSFWESNRSSTGQEIAHVLRNSKYFVRNKDHKATRCVDENVYGPEKVDIRESCCRHWRSGSVTLRNERRYSRAKYYLKYDLNERKQAGSYLLLLLLLLLF